MRFDGARVALLESRLGAETAAMVRRLGGAPIVAPSLAEVEVDADGGIRDLVARLAASADTVIVFLTGAAVTRLFASADRLGVGDSLPAALAAVTTIARGPKPAGALARRGVKATTVVPEPFTTADVIASLAEVPVNAREVTVVHYGERSEAVVSSLVARGANVHELMLYEWRLPEDIGPLSRVVDLVVGGAIDVLAFTSQIQVRHLLEVAGPKRRDALVAALNTAVIVGAVGPTCAAACEAAGLRGVITPVHPKLAPLLSALATAHAGRRAGERRPMKESRRDDRTG